MCQYFSVLLLTFVVVIILYRFIKIMQQFATVMNIAATGCFTNMQTTRIQVKHTIQSVYMQINFNATIISNKHFFKSWIYFPNAIHILAIINKFFLMFKSIISHNQNDILESAVFANSNNKYTKNQKKIA